MKSVRYLLPVFVATGAFSACTGRSVAPAPAPVPVAAPSGTPAIVAPPVAAVNRYRLPAVTPERRYAVQSSARVERDSAGKRDDIELRSSARVRFSLQHEAFRTRGSGVVDSFTVQGFERLRPTSPSPVAEPISVQFDLTIDSSQVRVSTRPPLANECDRPEAAATSLVRDILVRLPRELQVGDTWRDSSVAFVCRGAVPIAMRVRSQFVVDRVDGRGDDTALLITRTMETTLDGSMVGPWRTVSVRGTGNGTQALRVSARSGALLELDGKNTLTLQVREQTVTQNSTIKVRIQP